MIKHQFKIIYPQTRTVSAARVFVWALDAFENKETSIQPNTLGEAVKALEDAGQATFVNVQSFLSSPEANKIISKWDLSDGSVS